MLNTLSVRFCGMSRSSSVSARPSSCDKARSSRGSVSGSTAGCAHVNHEMRLNEKPASNRKSLRSVDVQRTLPIGPPCRCHLEASGEMNWYSVVRSRRSSRYFLFQSIKKPSRLALLMLRADLAGVVDQQLAIERLSAVRDCRCWPRSGCSASSGSCP